MDHTKLTQILLDILSSESLPALVCNASQNEHGWLYLKAVSDRHDENVGQHIVSVWDIRAGYPHHDPPYGLLRNFAGEEYEVVEWQSELFIHFRLKGSVAFDTIADVIINIMTEIQKIDDTSGVTLVLE